ncbi:MAG: GNAT family N-acetyltransferase [Acidimicrobiales bacterium]
MFETTINAELITTNGALSVFHAAIDELNRRYEGSDDGHHLHVNELAPPRGIFLVARVDGHLAGGVGVRPIGASGSNLGEVKRLWVRPDLRRGGVAQRLMQAVERQARELGFRQLFLETGYAQPEAVAFYQKTGWTPVEKFPDGAFSYPQAFRFTKFL